MTSIHDGYTAIGVSGSEATSKVLEYRTLYAQWILANTVTKNLEYAPTNEDMSVYV